MFTKSAPFYDAIYAAKDYKAEAATVRALIEESMQRPARTLLDVACGTGKHLAELRSWFEVEGIDLNEDLLALARARLPDVRFHVGDMAGFDLSRSFDVVTCLFSAIGSMTNIERLNSAIASMARHVAPGGLLIVEPWWSPGDWRLDCKPHAIFVDQPNVKIARMSISGREGNVAILDFNYLLGTPEGIIAFTEPHRLGLFTTEEQLAAFRAAGLEVRHDPVGLTGRGVFVGRRAELPS
jgi:ubiquinone/menaquinone biosynthesis C-methylase UbiE